MNKTRPVNPNHPALQNGGTMFTSDFITFTRGISPGSRDGCALFIPATFEEAAAYVDLLNSDRQGLPLIILDNEVT